MLRLQKLFLLPLLVALTQISNATATSLRDEAIQAIASGTVF
jgi:hypothetical protein